MTTYGTTLLASHDFPFHIMPFRLRREQPVLGHQHEFVECVWIAEGQGEHLYQGQVSPLAAGDVFVIEPGEEHGYQVTTAEVVGYNILFLPSLLQAEFAMLARVSSFLNFFYVEPFLRHQNHFVAHLQLTPAEHLEIRFLCERIEREARQQQDGYRAMIKAQLLQLFVTLSRFYQERSHVTALDTASDEAIMSQIGAFIASHYAMPLTLHQLSQMSGMSVSAFKTKFKQYTGKTLLEMRNAYRLQQAQTLLATTSHKISTIAAQVGFADLSFFYSLFKKTVGMSPGEYRQRRHHASIDNEVKCREGQKE